MPDGVRRRLSYPGYGGYGFSDMGMPSGEGSQALAAMTELPAAGAPAPQRSDPLWSEIESTFTDILGDYAEMDLDMPIQPPNMEDPQDQLRYLKDLEALGMSSAPSAALMRERGMDMGQALQIFKLQRQLEKDRTDMMLKVLPMLEGNKDLQVAIAAQLMNTLMPMQFQAAERGIWGTPTVERITPETAIRGEMFDMVSANVYPEIMKFAQAKDEEGLHQYKLRMIETLTETGMSPDVVEAMLDEVYRQVTSEIAGREITF